MTVTLQQLYEYYDAKSLSYQIIVGGADVSKLVDNFEYGFDVSQVPTATFEIPSALLVPAVAEEASVEIWLGFKLGMINLRTIVFGGGIVNSLSYNGAVAVVECVQDAARRLTFPYYRQIEFEFDNVTAQNSVEALLALAGVFNFKVDLDPWTIGTAVPQKLQFSNYGEAINKVSEVDGSPWYAMPTGQIRVEKRDPLPYDNPARTYFSGRLVGPFELTGTVPDASARPRNLDVSKSFDRAGVYNFIEVDGAVLVTLGPNGEQNSEQIIEEVDGAPGNFASGAPWIPTPPLFQMFTLQNELIDTNAKANTVAGRYYTLKNRLIQNLSVTIPIDPLLFLAMTIKIVDEDTNTDDLYYLKSYRCSVSGTQAISELSLLGGPYSGTQGFAKPFAEFIWKYKAFHEQLPGSSPPNSSQLNLGWNADLAAKLCQDLPADTGTPEQGGDLSPGDDKATVMITFDASPSQDFDGRIVQYDWSDDQGHTKSSILPRFTVVYDPDDGDTIQMTLTVTDDTARTDMITKSVYVGATAPPSPLLDDPTMDDTLYGGGAGAGDCTDGGSPHGGSGPGGKNGMALVYFVAAGCKAMATANNRDWNDLDKDDLGVGDFISVAMSSVYASSTVYAVFGTDNGEIVITADGCQTGAVVLRVSGGPQITNILYDPEEIYRVWVATDDGRIYTSTDSGQSWTQYATLGTFISKLLVLDGNLFVFGGDTSQPSSLIKIDSGKQKAWSSLSLGSALTQAALAAGAGNWISAAAFNQNTLLIGFSGGVSPLAWTASNPINNPESWTPTDVTGSEVLAAEPGVDGKYVVSTDDGIFRTLDNENFDLGDSTPVNDLAWEGLDGVYVGVRDTSVTKTIDDGNTNGDLRPNAQFDPDWPACAIGREIAIGIIPRDDIDGEWPAISTPPDIDDLTQQLRESIGFNGPFGRSFLLNNTGHSGLLFRYLYDENSLFDVDDDLGAWTLLIEGVSVSPSFPGSFRIEYKTISLNGQTVNWFFNAAAGANYQVFSVYFPTKNIGTPTGSNGSHFDNNSICDTTLTGPQDITISTMLNTGGGGPVFMQAPLQVVGGNTGIGVRNGDGACNWHGLGLGPDPYSIDIGNVGLAV